MIRNNRCLDKSNKSCRANPSTLVVCEGHKYSIMQSSDIMVQSTSGVSEIPTLFAMHTIHSIDSLCLYCMVMQ